jgi:hypothetical protein
VETQRAATVAGAVFGELPAGVAPRASSAVSERIEATRAMASVKSVSSSVVVTVTVRACSAIRWVTKFHAPGSSNHASVL